MRSFVEVLRSVHRFLGWKSRVSRMERALRSSPSKPPDQKSNTYQEDDTHYDKENQQPESHETKLNGAIFSLILSRYKV